MKALVCNILLRSISHRFGFTSATVSAVSADESQTERSRHKPLSRDDDSLALSVCFHVSVCIFGDCKEMGFQIPAPSSTVSLNDLGTIKRDALEGIDCD